MFRSASSADLRGWKLFVDDTDAGLRGVVGVAWWPPAGTNRRAIDVRELGRRRRRGEEGHKVTA